ncbi:hypothetical protein EV401DRAFT_1598778 [Pisolithus croceorrhizus]|nr:hypothetical protein EV401DRAFT_1598778 [Pisolithus croceorrhizus]
MTIKIQHGIPFPQPFHFLLSFFICIYRSQASWPVALTTRGPCQFHKDTGQNDRFLYTIHLLCQRRVLYCCSDPRLELWHQRGANSDFLPVASGGNGDSVQYWYVGYDPSLGTVIVAHQGTNPSEILPLVTDADLFLTNLDSSLFPGISSDIEVHNGS